MRTFTSMLAAGLMALGVYAQALAADPPLPNGLYTIAPSSKYFQGCIAPCQCIVVYLDDLRGSFALRYTHSDPVFDYYDVDRAVLDTPALQWRYTGEGTLRIGGEVAVVQSLSLDLSLADNPPANFQGAASGAPAGTVSVQISMNDLDCYDTLFTIEARPCRADIDRSGEVTPADVGSFIQVWIASIQGGTLAGDYDGNGQVTPADVAAFVSSWLAAIEGNCP
ncbi:MAG: hypothetical protein KF745_00860 [Phycisphaeraceae bacterium]|nr:hypothetical protein [Phycisphaeraceae bacterium]